MQILFVIAAAAFVYWAFKNGYLKTDNGQMAQLVRTFGGYALIGTAISMLMSGKFYAGIPMGLVGLWLSGIVNIPGVKNFTSMLSSQKTEMLDISLDPASGRIVGRVTSGVFAGRELDSLSRQECYALMNDLGAADQTGQRLFAVYLDGRFPGWREDLQGGAHAGASQQARSGVMTHEEAYKILGLRPGADEAAIREAHRRLMLKLHPDVGGSDPLAALVNEAKDILLRRHR